MAFWKATGASHHEPIDDGPPSEGDRPQKKIQPPMKSRTFRA